MERYDQTKIENSFLKQKKKSLYKIIAVYITHAVIEFIKKSKLKVLVILESWGIYIFFYYFDKVKHLIILTYAICIGK